MAEVSLDPQSPEDKIAQTLRTAKFEAEAFLRQTAISSETERECYVYLIMLPDGTPRYVGKGQGRRIRKHGADGKRHSNFLLAKDYEQYGALPIRKVVDGLTNDESLSLEKHLIEYYGIAEEGGLLANLNLGGYCVAPLVGVARERHKKAIRAYLSQPKVREQRLLQLEKIRNDEEIQARRAENMRKAMSDPEFRERRRVIGLEVSSRPDVIAKRSAGISKAKFAYWAQHAPRVEVRGEMLTRREIAQKYGLSLGLIKSRMQSGKRGEDLIAPIDTRFSHRRI